MRTCVISPNNGLVDSNFSIKSQWVKLMNHQYNYCTDTSLTWDINPRKSALKSYDTVLIFLGLDWKGKLNLFGGYKNNPYFDYLNYITEDQQICFLAHKPGVNDYKDFLKEVEYLLGPCKITRILENAVTHVIDQSNYLKKAVIGDGHSISLYEPGAFIDRHDYLSLTEALDIGLHNFIKKKKWAKSLEKVTFYFGNKDIRHILMTKTDPRKATIELAHEYIKQLCDIEEFFGLEVAVSHVLPIEPEDRNTMGKYKIDGKSFHGSHKDRMILSQLFNNCLDVSHFNTVSWPNDLNLYSLDRSLVYLNPEKLNHRGCVHLNWEQSILMRGDYEDEE